MDYYYDYLDKRVISKINSERIAFRRVFDGLDSGIHGSKAKGYNVEFSQHRNYYIGDEIKNIDWRMYGKSEKLYVKEFEEDTNFRACIFLDSSESMNYNSKNYMTKLEYGKRLVSHLSYFFLKQNDQVGFGTFSSKVEKFYKPKTGLSRINFIIKKLKETSNSDTTDLKNVSKDILKHIKKRGLVIIISDFIDERNDFDNIFKIFLSKKIPVFAIKINDEMEKEFNFKRFSIFYNPENGNKLKVDPINIKKKYLENYQEHSRKLKYSCQSSKSDFIEILTKERIEKIIINLISIMRKGQ